MAFHGPSSLPSDYAILASYRSSQQLRDDAYDTAIAEDEQPPSPTLARDSWTPGTTPTISRIHKSRRLSVPAADPSYKPVANIPDMHPGHSHKPTETDPLLPPRIPEPCDFVPVESTGSSLVREEGWILLRYTLPVFIAHLLEYSLTVVSVLSIGHISTTALAGVTIGTMTASVTGLSIIQGFASALDTLLPSAFTSSDPTLVGLWSQRTGVVMALTLVPIATFWYNAEPVLLALKQEPEVARLASEYLRWLSIGLPGFVFNTISRRYFQSQGLFTVPTRIVMFVAPINAVLNYLLVWGPEPIRMGFIGAPLATAVSFNLISLFSIIYGKYFAPSSVWRPFSVRSFTQLGIVVQLGLSGVGQTASEWWSWELVGLAASLLGPVALAAQSVLLVTGSTSWQAPNAMSVASSVRIGNLLGEQNAARARAASHAAMLLALGVAGIFSTTFLVFRDSWGYIFNDDIEVVKLVAQIMPIVALFQVFDGMSALTAGIMRARGQQSIGALLNLIGYYILGIPIGIWLAFNWNFGLEGLWMGLSLALILVSGVGLWLSLKADWEKEVRKVKARLEVDMTPTDDGSDLSTHV